MELLVLAAAGLLTIIVLIVIWRTLRKRAPKIEQAPDTLDNIPPEKPRDPEDSSFFRVTLALILTAGAYLIVDP